MTNGGEERPCDDAFTAKDSLHTQMRQLTINQSVIIYIELEVLYI